MITHPEKVLFPDDGITKGELCAYYEAVAPAMLPHLRGRPVTMERFPSGIGKKGFIQKDVSKGFPSWLERVEVEKRTDKEGGAVHYPLANDARALVWLANQNSITPHVWCARVPALDRPDLCIFDLDPLRRGPGGAAKRRRSPCGTCWASWGCRRSSRRRARRASTSWYRSTTTRTSRRLRRFAHGAGAVLVKRHPEVLTQEFIKADRAGRIFVDTGRNAPGATFAAVYAVRPKAGAPVSAPCTWQEVDSGGAAPQTFGLRAMAARARRRRRALARPPE